jgi:Flp pilus assembly protein TadG
MNKINLFFRPLKFLHHQAGLNVIEFAFVLPIMILVVTGIFEITMYTLAINKISHTAGVINDLVARESESITRAQLTADVTAALSAVPKLLEPFSANPSQVIVSLVYNLGQTANVANMRLNWQVKYKNTGNSKFGIPPNAPVNMPNGLTVTNDTEAVITEIFYTYTPLVFRDFFQPIAMYQTVVHVPRFGTLVKP